ncbi:hypothetical protein TNCV_1534821 [Trichonephila clavipes]|uniref:Uncharacterized protein n=1 Tax=Trichonephila clavipes TaxID=2585209 RepID=A0A8X6RG64_TRICX|nr:hypothetical protein TNCV_1534821 [Trichonephila clavipes]
MYTIAYEPSQAQIIFRLPPQFHDAFFKTIDKLMLDPLRSSKALNGPWKGHRCVRYGARRIIFRLDQKLQIVIICKEDARGSVYKR